MVRCISVRKGDVHNNVGVRFTRYISAKSCFELIAQSPYSACQASAAMQQDFAEYIIKFRYLFRADNICPYGWHVYRILFNAVGATPCGRPLPCDCPLVLNSFPHLCTVGAAVCIRPHEISHIFMYYFRMGTYFAIYRVVARCHAVARCVFHIQIYFTF